MSGYRQLLQINGCLLLLTLLAACSSKSSSKDLTKELQTVTSWTATVQMAGDNWLHANVPTVYAKETFSKAHKKLQKETEKLSHLSVSTQRRTILEHLQHLELTVGKMSNAVEQKDHTAMAQQLKQLSTQQQTLTEITKTAEGKNE